MALRDWEVLVNDRENRERTDSFEIFPSLKAAQSIFPAPTFQAWPRQFQNSVSVSPGGRRRMMSRDLGAGFLEEGLAAAAGVGVFLAAALTGNTPPERPLEELDIVVSEETAQGMRLAFVLV